MAAFFAPDYFDRHIHHSFYSYDIPEEKKDSGKQNPFWIQLLPVLPGSRARASMILAVQRQGTISQPAMQKQRLNHPDTSLILFTSIFPLLLPSRPETRDELMTPAKTSQLLSRCYSPRCSHVIFSALTLKTMKLEISGSPAAPHVIYSVGPALESNAMW